MNERIELMLFVVDPNKYQELIEQFEQSLEENYPEAYCLTVVDVLAMPEKATENQVFATPMLIRKFPEPVQKMLIDIANLKDVFLIVSGLGESKVIL